MTTDYHGFVKKAHNLRQMIGKPEFQKRYMTDPRRLVEDIRTKSALSAPEMELLGKRVLRSMGAHVPLQGREEVYSRLLENVGKKPLIAATLGAPSDVAKSLRELEKEGLVRVGRLYKDGPLIVTEVFDGRAWKKSLIPERFAKSLAK